MYQPLVATGGMAVPATAWPAPAAPRQLKRQWQQEDEEAQQQHGFVGSEPQMDAVQLPRSRRRVASRADTAPLVAVPAPGQPPQLQAPPQQMLSQKRQHERDPDMDLESADGLGGSGSTDLGEGTSTSEEPAHRRARTGTPEYRLMLPTPLPPAIPLAAPVVPSWGQQLHEHTASQDAWALVPYAPSLVQPPPQEQAQQMQPLHAPVPQGRGIQIQELLAAAQGLQLKFDHEQPLPEVDTTAMATDEGPAPTVVFEELPPDGALGNSDAMEE